MSDPSTFSGVSAFFTADHRDCDGAWALVEAAGEGGDDARTMARWVAFRDAMLRHFSFEEDVLFPTFEQATGMTQGPTAMMRIEHTQMRGLMSQMDTLAAAGDFEGLLDQGDTLLMLTQQHNMKEEQMLYPMTDRTIGGMWPQLQAKLVGHPSN